MNASDYVEKIILEKYKSLPPEHKTRYKAGINYVLALLSNMTVEGEVITHCSQCLNAYVPKHASGKGYKLYCTYHQMGVEPEDHCSWKEKDNNEE